MDYKLLLIMALIDTLEEQQEVVIKRFFRRAVMPESSCLRYLLLDLTFLINFGAQNISTADSL